MLSFFPNFQSSLNWFTISIIFCIFFLVIIPFTVLSKVLSQKIESIKTINYLPNLKKYNSSEILNLLFFWHNSVIHCNHLLNLCKYIFIENISKFDNSTITIPLKNIETKYFKKGYSEYFKTTQRYCSLIQIGISLKKSQFASPEKRVKINQRKFYQDLENLAPEILVILKDKKHLILTLRTIISHFKKTLEEETDEASKEIIQNFLILISDTKMIREIFLEELHSKKSKKTPIILPPNPKNVYNLTCESDIIIIAKLLKKYMSKINYLKDLTKLAKLTLTIEIEDYDPLLEDWKELTLNKLEETIMNVNNTEEYYILCLNLLYYVRTLKKPEASTITRYSLKRNT